MLRPIAMASVLVFLLALSASAAELPSFLTGGSSTVCNDQPALGPMSPAPVQKTCGPVCIGSYRMPYTGSTLAADYTCSGATTGLNNVLLSSANSDCVNNTGRNACNFNVIITDPCYQYTGGTLYYVGGYATYSCKDTTC